MLERSNVKWSAGRRLFTGMHCSALLCIVMHFHQKGGSRAVMCAGTLWLGNSVYMYLSVAFIQMLKALMPVAVFATGCMFGIERFKFTTLANMVSC